MIKKHRNKNNYLLVETMWVRDFTKPLTPYIDINNTIAEKDHFLFLQNEFNNTRERYAWIDTEPIYHPKILIISDGYDFQNKQKELETLPSDVITIGVHGSLVKWKLPKSLNYYVVNNPYQECLNYLPRKNQILPKCIASTRTNHQFLKNYRGAKYRYVPVSEEKYSGMEYQVNYQIDDYRNPICAAIGLAYHFGVEKLGLFCCDDSFADKREGADSLPNGLWHYRPQVLAHQLIDGCLFWLKKTQKIRIFDHSSGPNYKNAEYIKTINEFFSSEI